jgi:hypothetical protein
VATLQRLLRTVQARAEADAAAKEDGPGHLGEVDRKFLAAARERIGRSGLGYGLATGGAAMVLLRNAKPVPRFAGVATAWLVGSAVGRVGAMSASLQELVALAPPSELGPEARAIIREYAEPRGFFHAQLGADAVGGDASDVVASASSAPTLASASPLGAVGGELETLSKGEEFLNDYFAKDPAPSLAPLAPQSARPLSPAYQQQQQQQQHYPVSNSVAQAGRGTQDPLLALGGPPVKRGAPPAASVPYDDNGGASRPSVPRRTWSDIRRDRQQQQQQQTTT